MSQETVIAVQTIVIAILAVRSMCATRDKMQIKHAAFMAGVKAERYRERGEKDD